MTSKEYIQKALRTHNDNYAYPGYNGVTPQIEHGVMGLVTESAEIMDAIKQARIYNKPLDQINLIEEMGDVMWYLAIMADALGVEFEEIWDKNIRKLEARYPDRFKTENGLRENRDLEAEREELES